MNKKTEKAFNDAISVMKVKEAADLKAKEKTLTVTVRHNERLLKLTHDQHAKIMKAVEWMQRISLKRIEENRTENPDYQYKDATDQRLQDNYMSWCNLQTKLEEADV